MGLEQVRIFDEQNNRTGSVNVNDLKYALNDGYKLHNAGENVKIIDPKTNRTGTVATNDLAAALNDGYQLAPATTKDSVQAFGQGIASNLGKYADTAVAAGSYLMSKNPLQKAVKAGADALGIGQSLPSTQQLRDQASDYWQNPKLEQVASDALDTGMNYRQGIRAAQTAGEFVGDIPAFKAVGTVAKGITALTKAGTAIKAPWLDKLNKFLDVPTGNAKEVGKAVTSFAGAGAGSELAKSNDPNVGVAESVARDVLGITLGAVAGEAIAAAGVKATKAVGNALIHPVETLKDFGITAATLPFRGKVDQKVYKNAKELGIELTPAMLTDSNLAKLAENNLFGSIFTARAYKETIDNISPSVIEAIDKELAKSVGQRVESTATDSVASTLSQGTTEQLQQNIPQWREESKKLFNDSVGKLTANDKLAVPKTIETIDSMLERLTSIENLKQGVKKQGETTEVLSDEKQVINTLTNIRNKLLPQSTIEGFTQPYVAALVNQQQILQDLGKYGQIVGAKNYYNGVASTLIEELEKYTINPDFHKDYKTARAFYKNYIVNGEQAKITKSLLHQQSPREAIAFMNTAQNIKTMEKLVGNSENGKKLMGSLKRAKIQEILEESNVFTGNGDFNADAFINVFSKQKKEDILQPLMGKGFSKLKQDILPIAEAMSNSKKTLNNPIVGNFAQAGLLGGIYTLSGGAAAIAGLGARAASIYALSSTMANPKFVEKLVVRANSPRFAAKTKAYIKDLPNNPAIKAGVGMTGAGLVDDMGGQSR